MACAGRATFQAAQEQFQLDRQRRLQLQQLPGRRVRELEPRRVQKVSSQLELLGLRFTPRRPPGRCLRGGLVRQLSGCSVERVAHDRVPDRGHVDSNLVGAAGLDAAA